MVLELLPIQGIREEDVDIRTGLSWYRISQCIAILFSSILCVPSNFSHIKAAVNEPCRDTSDKRTPDLSLEASSGSSLFANN